VFFLLTTSFPIKTEEVQKSKYQSQSFSQDNQEQNYIVDLDNIDNIKNMDDLEKNTNTIDRSFIANIQRVTSSNTILMFIYTAILSFLFIYREKQNRAKILLLEERDDELKIAIAKKNETIYKDITQELKPYEELIKNDIRIDQLDTRINEEPKYIIIASKNIVEQIITRLYKKYFNEENTNLNIMMMSLYKKRVLGHDLNNYAHIIKAFGNKANHTGKIFDSQEAMLVIGNLLQFLKELDNKKLLEKV
jgi:hypothetical protein